MRALPDGAKASSFVKTYMPSFITQKAMCTRHRRTVELETCARVSLKADATPKYI